MPSNSKSIEKLPFKTEVALAFDPANASDEVKEVFANPIARSLWLAIKIGHIVNQYFDEGCLDVARWIKHQLSGESDQSREVFISVVVRNITFGDNQLLGSANSEREFAKALIEYLLDGGEVTYTRKNPG